MKRFWKINYSITGYCIILVFVEFLYGIKGTNDTIKLFHTFFTINTYGTLLSFVIEWVQFPVCLAIILIKKSERTKLHYNYLVALFVFNLLKWIYFFIAVGAVVERPI